MGFRRVLVRSRYQVLALRFARLPEEHERAMNLPCIVEAPAVRRPLAGYGAAPHCGTRLGARALDMQKSIGKEPVNETASACASASRVGCAPPWISAHSHTQVGRAGKGSA